MRNFTTAIVRPPGANFAKGLTTSGIGKPDHKLALQQHRRYCRVLESCGVEIVRLDPDERFPDSTFVEDTALLTQRSAIVTRPGATSRRGECESISEVLQQYFSSVVTIKFPGTLDAGDVCEADGTFFIGISGRTNEEGERQLSKFLSLEGYGSVAIDIRSMPGLLHLKSGMAYLGNRTMVATGLLMRHPALKEYRIIRVPDDEVYAANCIRVNAKVLCAQGFPRTAELLRKNHFDIMPLGMSEFQKMDGGLSCLSLRF
jgi:dimethylargininase